MVREKVIGFMSRLTLPAAVSRGRHRNRAAITPSVVQSVANGRLVRCDVMYAGSTRCNSKVGERRGTFDV